MFEWLEEEMARIKTRKFHLVDGPAPAELRQAVESCKLPLPPSYKEFVLRFGNAELYRYSTNYYVTIFAGPREAENLDGEAFVQFGRTWTSYAYFRESLLVQSKESPVFESFQNGMRKTADGFDEWLKTKSIAARKRFKKVEWEAIEAGPTPFTDHERAVVAARKQFRWRVVGVAPNEDLRFEIHNGSAMTLPYLSVGIRGKMRPPKTGPLEGGGYLPTVSIHPGETRLLEYDCYKQFIAPEDTEVFELPEPGPEDREQYWEFKSSA
ncbi:MAG: SMI1/KNR4 family protein [Gemmataceae bacterium]|nr:SMI1/KNR4 family protein [Gemmataceae bacterium]